MQDTVIGRTEMASSRRIMLNVSNQPKAGGRQGEWPRQRKRTLMCPGLKSEGAQRVPRTEVLSHCS